MAETPTDAAAKPMTRECRRITARQPFPSIFHHRSASVRLLVLA